MANKRYDFLIVGAGFAGASCARLLTDKGYKCLIIEERPFVAGNCSNTIVNGVDVHAFGAHIIHTNDREVWNFLNTNGKIRKFYPEVKMYSNKELYSFPPNISTLREIYHVLWPSEAYRKLKEIQKDIVNINSIKDFCLANYGQEIYDLLYKDFIRNQFNIEPENISIDNLEFNNEISFVENHYLYSEKYQGIPEQGYTKYIETMLGDDIDVMLNKNFLSNKDKFMGYANAIIYTGELDKFFNYCMGALDWRSAFFDFQESSDNSENVMGMPIVLFNDSELKWYRVTEHKWLNPNNVVYESSYLTYEYYREWKIGEEACYPIISEKSIHRYNNYLNKLNEQYPNVLLCGRRAKYNNWHIADVVRDALDLANEFPYKD